MRIDRVKRRNTPRKYNGIQRDNTGGVRTTIALHCGWMISNMAAEAWLFGEFSYAFFKSMTSYIAFYFT